jgi:O-antigen/teichoic acid export membrane protein
MVNLISHNEKPARAGSLSAMLANIGWLLGGRGVSAVLSTVYIALIARTLGPSGFGQFALVVGIAQSLTALVGFQTWQIIVRFGMAHLHEGRRDALARLIKGCLALDIGGAIAGSLLAFAAVALLGTQFGWSAGVKEDALIFCVVSLIAVRSTPVGILRLHDRFDVAAYADTMLPIARFAGALTVWATAPSVQGFLVAWAVAEVCSALAFWWFAARTVRGLPFRAARLDRTMLGHENPGLLGFAGVTNAGQTFALASRQLPVLLIGLYVTPAAAGGFRLAHQLGQALAKVSQIAARALFPELVRARTLSGDPDHFARLLGRSIRLAAIAGAVILTVLLLAGKPLLGLIAGEAFLPAYPLLLLLGTAAVIDLVGVGFEPALVSSGRAGLSFRIQLVVAVVLIASLFVLVQIWGTVGAGIAVLTGSALSFAMMGIATWRAIRRRDPPVSSSDAVIFEGAEADVDRPDAL